MPESPRSYIVYRKKKNAPVTHTKAKIMKSAAERNMIKKKLGVNTVSLYHCKEKHDRLWHHCFVWKKMFAPIPPLCETFTPFIQSDLHFRIYLRVKNLTQGPNNGLRILKSPNPTSAPIQVICLPGNKHRLTVSLVTLYLICQLQSS